MYSAQPARSSHRNDPQPICMLPASGGAMVLMPGTNFATTSKERPRRWKVSAEVTTQDSGFSEMRHRVPSSHHPVRRPSRNISASPTSIAPSEPAEGTDRRQVPLGTLRASQYQCHRARHRQTDRLKEHQRDSISTPCCAICMNATRLLQGFAFGLD